MATFANTLTLECGYYVYGHNVWEENKLAINYTAENQYVSTHNKIRLSRFRQ